jgi:hypothetical protein
LPYHVPIDKRMIDKDLEKKWWLIDKGLKGHKKNEQRGKSKKIAPWYPKFLKNGLTWNDVESIYNVNLKHHPIKMGIQIGFNNMDHNLMTSSNCHLELIWWQMKSKHIMKLQT